MALLKRPLFWLGVTVVGALALQLAFVVIAVSSEEDPAQMALALITYLTLFVLISAIFALGKLERTMHQQEDIDQVRCDLVYGLENLERVLNDTGQKFGSSYAKQTAYVVRRVLVQLGIADCIDADITRQLRSTGALIREKFIDVSDLSFDTEDAYLECRLKRLRYLKSLWLGK